MLFLSRNPICCYELCFAGLLLELSPTPDNGVITVLEGNDLVVTCQPSVPLDPDQSLVWFDGSSFIIGSNRLELERVSQANAGTYRCYVASGIDTIASVSVEVVVEGTQYVMIHK